MDSYRVLERIADGLGIPRERMGLSYGPEHTYPEQVTVAEPEEAEDVFRRHLLAQGGIALTGATVTKLGELVAELPWPGSTPLPTQLTGVHVAQVRELTRGLDKTALALGSTPEVSTAAAMWAMRLLSVPGAEPVMKALRRALAELHLQAGWAGVRRGSLSSFGVPLQPGAELATESRDAYCQASP